MRNSFLILVVCAFDDSGKLAWVEQEVHVSLPVFGFASQELGCLDHLQEPRLVVAKREAERVGMLLERVSLSRKRYINLVDNEGKVKERSYLRDRGSMPGLWMEDITRLV
jgi:hypothetical protein